MTKSTIIQFIVYDFDGVLTDNRVLVNQDGTEAVFCNRGDGWWIGEIKKLGIPQLILSTEKNPVVAARGRKLDVEVVHGVVNKWSALCEILGNRRIPKEAVCYVGNEMNDFECMRNVGYPAAPSDSHPKILEITKIRLNVAGGYGVVRHLHDWLTSYGKS